MVHSTELSCGRRLNDPLVEVPTVKSPGVSGSTISSSNSCWFLASLLQGFFGNPLASYPGLLTPAFVACSTNAGEGLVKLSHVVWCTWTCGRVVHSFCTTVKRLSESKKRRQDCLMSSAQLFYGPCLQSVAHLLTCCFSGNVPLLHTSRYVIPHDSVLPGLPPR